MRARGIGLAVGILLAACGAGAGAPSDSALPGVGVGSSLATGATTADSEVPAATDPVFQDAVFLTAVDRILAGTSYAGLVDVDPEAFTETAATLCDRLDGGADPDDLLSEYLIALGEARTPVTADDASLAGALLGAGVQVYCPQHADQLPTD